MRPFILDSELSPLDEVPAWGDSHAGLELHWFGFTYGTYEMLVDGVSIYSTESGDRRVHYAVARLWEDLVELVPSVLEPIPRQLEARLHDINQWRVWANRAFELEGADEIGATALSWWYEREMAAYHLPAAPVLTMWRVSDQVHISWRPSSGVDDNWATHSGDSIITTEAFVDEIVSFDRRLISEMDERIEHVARQWERPSVHIDISDLRKEQAGRSHRLGAALKERPRAEHTWDEVLQAISKIDRLLEEA